MIDDQGAKLKDLFLRGQTARDIQLVEKKKLFQTPATHPCPVI